MLVTMLPKLAVSNFIGYLKDKSTLVIFESRCEVTGPYRGAEKTHVLRAVIIIV